MEEQEPSAAEMIQSISADSKPTEGAPAAAPAQPTIEEIEYAIQGGKLIKEPLDMVKKRAGMGYHYAQEMHRLNQERDQFKGKIDQIPQLEAKLQALQRWQEYDDYGRQNPDWAKHVEQTYANRGNMLQSNQANPLMETLAQRQEAIEKTLGDWQKWQEAEKFKTEDKQFVDEIGTVSKQYGVDLSQSDEQGSSLEWRVLNHMKKLGLRGDQPGQFTAAFKDFYFDNLAGRQKEQAAEQQVKNQAELKKAGIIDISRTPKKADSSNGYRPGMSWDQVGNLALQDIKQKIKL